MARQPGNLLPLGTRSRCEQSEVCTNDLLLNNREPPHLLGDTMWQTENEMGNPQVRLPIMYFHPNCPTAQLPFTALPK